MNPFAILSAVQQDYLTYVRIFQRFQNPEIRDWILERVHSGTSHACYPVRSGGV